MTAGLALLRHSKSTPRNALVAAPGRLALLVLPSGTVIGIMGASTPALQGITRTWMINDLGGARGFVPELVKMGTDGNLNVLVHYGIVDAPLARTATDTGAFIGNDLESTRAVKGYVTVLVKLNEAVTKGQKIAVQRNSFGDIVHAYLASADGRVAIIGTDSATERGGTIASLLVKHGSCANDACDYGGIEP